MSDYEETYAAYYDYRATGLEGDVPFYVEEAQRAGSPVLELGCGTGRILIPVAQAGVEVVGLDLSRPMLTIARKKIAALEAETQRRIEVVEGDMRRFSLGRRFKLAMIPYRAFLHLLTPEDERQALACIREHLTEDGRLVFNIFDPRLDIIAEHSSSFGTALKKVSEFIHPETGHRFVIWDTRQYDVEQQVIKQYFIHEALDADGRAIAKFYTPLTLRYVFRWEMQHLLELCGFQVEALYGDFGRGPFRYGGEQIWVARPLPPPPAPPPSPDRREERRGSAGAGERGEVKAR
jgi:SAM-dependent methyltransferase